MTRRAAMLAGTCAALSAGVVASLVGCASDPAQGYTFRSTFPKNVRTVAVPVFDNQTFTQGLERDLTDAVIKEIQRRTPMVVVNAAGTSAAQTTLTGIVRQGELRHLTTSGQTGLVQEMAQEIVIDFQWRDASTGQDLASVQGLRAIESFIPARGVGERLELAQQAVAQELARKIVSEMRADW